MNGLTRVSVAGTQENCRDGDSGDRDLEEAAHLKRVVGVSTGRNGTDVLFKWPANNFVLMASRWPMWAERYFMHECVECLSIEKRRKSI